MRTVEKQNRSASMRIRMQELFQRLIFYRGTGHHRDSLNYDFQIGKGDFMMFRRVAARFMEETGQLL